MSGIPSGNKFNAFPPKAADASGASAAGAAAAGGACDVSGIPVRRYSTALSGLLNAARIAFMTCSRSNPMVMICVTAASNSAPETSPESPPAAAGTAVAAAGVGALDSGVAAATGAAASGAAAAGVGVGGFAAAALGFAAAFGFCTITTTNDSSVTPADAIVASSFSTLPLCTKTIASSP